MEIGVLSSLKQNSQGIIQKKYERIDFLQSQRRLQLGVWGELQAPKGVQGDALAKAWVWNPQTFFFRIKRTKTVTVTVNIG